MTEVVAALIWKEDKFLICQRPANKARALMWEFVGGKLEEGETHKEALIRECREELGIELNIYDEYMDVSYTYPDMIVHLTLFNASIKSGEPKMLEHVDMRWISVEDIPDYEFCPADIDIIKKLKKRADKH